jgi:alkylation response protein AidB-like acyl-CoA dehydrogenase
MRRWSAAQVALREGLARWHEALSADHVESDQQATFPWDKWKLLGEAGVPALPFPEEWGGRGQDLLTTMYVLEELGYGCRDSGLTFALTTTIASTGVPLAKFGSTELKRRYLPRVCAGEAIGAHAITEAEGGSDALRMRTRAVRDGDHYVLNGGKTFVTNAPVADLLMVYAATDPDGGVLGVTAFLVPKDTPGLTVSQPIAKMGLRTAQMGELTLRDCRVPASHVVGRVGGGFMVLDYVMKREVLYSFVVNVGEMQHRLERCVAFAKSRRQFGQPIGAFQSIANKIVDMKIGVETSRKWLYDTGERLAAGENVTTDMAIAKLVTSRANLDSSLAAVQIFGGRGYVAEFGMEMEVRNSVAGTIYSGTNEIQYNRVASMLGL